MSNALFLTPTYGGGGGKMMEKGNFKGLLKLMIITVAWTIAMNAAASLAAVGDTSSDEWNTPLQGGTTGEFALPISLSPDNEIVKNGIDFDIKFVLYGTVTFNGSTDVHILEIDNLSGLSVSSEQGIELGVGTYTVTEDLKLRIKPENLILRLRII